jgi:hypothetical protein
MVPCIWNMQDIEQSILNTFRKNPSREHETSELAREIFLEEYSNIAILMGSMDKPTVNDAKRRKFQLHRKLLYYLNKLVDEKILRVSSIKEKGEKSFSLAVEEGDITLEKGYKRIIITKPSLSSNQIELYEKQKIMKKFEEESWINRFNSVLLECSKMPTIERVYALARECFRNINDAIALNDFEIILNSLGDDDTKYGQIEMLLQKLSLDTLNLDKTVSLIINADNARIKAFKAFIACFAKQNPRKINVIFNLTSKELQKNSETFEYIIKCFSEAKIKINIKNRELNSAPFFKGRAGIYNFDEDEWRTYLETSKGSIIGLNCSQSAIAINVEKFFELYKTGSELRQAMLNAAKVLLSANTIQRRKSNDYFKNINIMNSPNSAEFYKYSRNYIRFWNYDWHKDLEEDNNLLELIKSSKEIIDNFCHSEETIFKSCGIPIRFKIVFSSAFRNFDTAFMGERDYKKANVRNVEDFYKGEIKDFIMARERLFEVFDGGDRLRIFRTSEFSPVDVVHEFGILLNSFRIPFFTYDFSQLRGVIRLTNYI